MTRPKRIVTGRIMSSEPNRQNIPIRTEEGRRVRDAFQPKKLLIDADYFKLEYRVRKRVECAEDDE